jgi:hypothetical protein
VPVNSRARRGRQLQRWLAASFATLLAIAPFTRPSWTIDSAVAAVSVESIAAQDDDRAQAKQPAAKVRPAQPSTPGILSRVSLLETALGLPPVKSPVLRSSVADELAVAPQAMTAHRGVIGQLFHRSSVGTARTPTGPPS